MITHFIRNERGAITVDWVVLSAAFAGLSIAAAGMLTGGIETLMEKLDGELGTSSISTPPPPIALAAFDFADGTAPGWTNGSVMTPIDALGDVLVLGAGQSTEYALDFPSGRDTAVISFDLIGGDSIDHEKATIKINGETVALAEGKWGGSMGFEDLNVAGIQIDTEIVSEKTNLGGQDWNNWNDWVTTVTITVADPGDTLTFGMQSGTNQSIQDEFFGLDNFSVTALY